MIFNLHISTALAISGGEFVNGQGTITQSGNNTNITAPHKSIINWANFDTTPSKTFILPSQTVVPKS